MFRSLIAQAEKRIRAARTRRVLQALPDSILHDIGLSRGGIDAVSRGGI